MKQLRATKALVSVNDEYIVRILIDDQAALDKTDILEINRVKNQLVGDNRYVVIFIPGKGASINHDGRVASSSKEVYKNAIAKAIIAPNMTSRLIATFFINMNRPPAPTKFFDDEVSAIQWLKSQMKKEKEMSKGKNQ
ncbi:MAG: hypothetical protein ACOZCO_00550 [Bacteroidota bacterium]